MRFPHAPDQTAPATSCSGGELGALSLTERTARVGLEEEFTSLNRPIETVGNTQTSLQPQQPCCSSITLQRLQERVIRRNEGLSHRRGGKMRCSRRRVPRSRGVKGRAATTSSTFAAAGPLLGKSVCKMSNSLCTFPFGCSRRRRVPGVCPAAGGRMWSHTSRSRWLMGARRPAPQSPLRTPRARKPCRKTRHEGCLGSPHPAASPPPLLATSRPGVSLFHFQIAEQLCAPLPARSLHGPRLLHRAGLQARRWCCKNGVATTARPEPGWKMLNHPLGFIKPHRLPDLLTRNQQGPKVKEPEQLIGHLSRSPLLRNLKSPPWFSALQNFPLWVFCIHSQATGLRGRRAINMALLWLQREDAWAGK